MSTMNAVKAAVYTSDTSSPWWQLAENLNGRIARRIWLVDDQGELTEELKMRGVDVVRRVEYRLLRPSAPAGSLENTLTELDPEKVRNLLRSCDTQLVMVVEEPERTEVPQQEGVTVSTVKRRSILSVLDQLNVNYSYKTILSGDLGCFVVEGLA